MQCFSLHNFDIAGQFWHRRNIVGIYISSFSKRDNYTTFIPTRSDGDNEVKAGGVVDLECHGLSPLKS